MKALLSIRPEYVDRIKSGEKLYEYRKRIFKREVESVVIYSTMPEGKIVGEFYFDEVLEDTPKKLWDMTRENSGITQEFFMEYFNGCERAFAFKIREYKAYSKPINPKDIFDDFKAPQSYKYLNGIEIVSIMNMD